MREILLNNNKTAFAWCNKERLNTNNDNFTKLYIRHINAYNIKRKDDVCTGVYWSLDATTTSAVSLILFSGLIFTQKHITYLTSLKPMPLLRSLQSARIRSKLAESNEGSPDGTKTSGCDTGTIEAALSLEKV